MDLKKFTDKTNLEIMDYLRIKILRERKKLKLSQEGNLPIINCS